jgi:cytochrome oxidase assembly protein ShyY1
VRQTLDIGEFAAQTGLRLRPFFLEQHSPADDGLLRDWPAPDTGVAMHESYSLQWYSFAVAVLALFVVLSFRRVSPR